MGDHRGSGTSFVKIDPNNPEAHKQKVDWYGKEVTKEEARKLYEEELKETEKKYDQLAKLNALSEKLTKLSSKMEDEAKQSEGEDLEEALDNLDLGEEENK